MRVSTPHMVLLLSRRFCLLGRQFRCLLGLVAGVSWQGAFLIKGLGLAQGSIGLLGALPAGASVVVIFAAGWYSQRLLAQACRAGGARPAGRRLRCTWRPGLAVMPYVPRIPAKIALATIGIAVPSVINVIGHCRRQRTDAGRRSAARLLAIGTAIATSAGLLAPYVMGSVVETAATPLAGFNTGFMICASSCWWAA